MFGAERISDLRWGATEMLVFVASCILASRQQGLFDVLFRQRDEAPEPDYIWSRVAHLPEVQSEGSRAVLLLLPIHTYQAIGVLISEELEVAMRIRRRLTERSSTR